MSEFSTKDFWIGLFLCVLPFLVTELLRPAVYAHPDAGRAREVAEMLGRGFKP